MTHDSMTLCSISQTYPFQCLDICRYCNLHTIVEHTLKFQYKMTCNQFICNYRCTDYHHSPTLFIYAISLDFSPWLLQQNTAIDPRKILVSRYQHNSFVWPSAVCLPKHVSPKTTTISKLLVTQLTLVRSFVTMFNHVVLKMRS